MSFDVGLFPSWRQSSLYQCTDSNPFILGRFHMSLLQQFSSPYFNFLFLKILVVRSQTDPLILFLIFPFLSSISLSHGRFSQICLPTYLLHIFIVIIFLISKGFSVCHFFMASSSCFLNIISASISQKVLLMGLSPPTFYFVLLLRLVFLHPISFFLLVSFGLSSSGWGTPQMSGAPVQI